MRSPITIGLHRSFLLGLGLAVVHVVAVSIVCFPPWSFGLKIALFGGIVGSALFSWRKFSPAVNRLRLLGNGYLKCEISQGAGWQVAELLPGAIVHPWLTVIHLRLSGRRIALTLLPDNMPQDDYRCLRVWLRWRAQFNVGKGGAV